MSQYRPTIGLEVHAELNTKSKMFCGCANDPHAAEPNTNICPVCMAHPGTLPVVNKEAVKKVLILGKAIGGEVADFSEFDRKQYFYPDIPKAYQLSQYVYPFVKGGMLSGVAITRVHLEEDTAKSQHVNANGRDTNASNASNQNASQVDFNRAGVPLMELVTEPVVHSAKEAVQFAKELQLMLRTLGVSDANMEKGEMRVEANISISATDQLGTKVEVKNLNSFRAVEQAIDFEISRQSEILDKNGLISQETRGWDETKSRTFPQRSKEGAKDYRYFPDPDIPKYLISEVSDLSEEHLAQALPALPSEIRLELANFGLNDSQVEVLTFDPELRKFLEAGFDEEKDPQIFKLAANYIISDINGIRLSDPNAHLNPKNARGFIELIKLVASKEISSRVAKDLLIETVFEGKNPLEMAQNRGLMQKSSAQDLHDLVQAVLGENEAVVEEFKSGKEAALQYLVGQGMKISKGSANPEILAELIRQVVRG